MRKLTASEKKVLESLIHVESMDALKDETGLPYGALRDDLTSLISARYIEVFSDNVTSGVFQRSAFFDLDHLYLYHFRATTQGLTALRTAR